MQCLVRRMVFFVPRAYNQGAVSKDTTTTVNASIGLGILF